MGCVYCILTVCAFIGCVLEGIEFAPRHGMSRWAGAGWGVVAAVILIVVYAAFMKVLDEIVERKRLRELPERRKTLVALVGFLWFFAFWIWGIRLAKSYHVGVLLASGLAFVAYLIVLILYLCSIVLVDSYKKKQQRR